MTGPLAIIIRFNGDPDDLIDRFEKARQLWIAGQDADYDPPASYAACKTDQGMAVITVWETDAAHKAFARQIRPHLARVGMGAPEGHEHLRVEKLGWD